MDSLYEKRDAEFQGSGWAFPVTFSLGNLQLNMSTYEDNIKDSINLVLQTKNGERNFDPQFGSNLQQFIFKKMDETLKGEITNAVKSALLFNEPRITVKSVSVEYTDIAAGLVQISIGYVFNQTNTRHNYVFPYYLKEGTNLGG